MTTEYKARIDLHAHLLNLLGAEDHEDAARIIARLHHATPQAQQQITSDMVREAEAHYPAALDAESTRNSRWHWFADYYNNALAKPNEPCPCCNVTPDGDILDHLQLPEQARSDDGSAS